MRSRLEAAKRARRRRRGVLDDVNLTPLACRGWGEAVYRAWGEDECMFLIFLLPGRPREEVVGLL